MSKVYCGNLDWSVNEDDIEKHMSNAGKIIFSKINVFVNIRKIISSDIDCFINF